MLASCFEVKPYLGKLDGFAVSLVEIGRKVGKTCARKASSSLLREMSKHHSPSLSGARRFAGAALATSL